ncbi:isopentenyl-diphosphate-delta-isomerase II [Tubulinosema ratisbonensis]|uniref:isopentenyl-diphosphate Delta-isomerase n=1 Tax=Tubulinosema ratisbonensis TaxID=291195 RepID=A0A437AKH3_9MICR|nr:isopentenyl-diphosphate-delta-isomerase II [Tubulinosema ratisbonensis]
MDNYKRNLIVVNEEDVIIGTKKALLAHKISDLTLHRAFSVFIFNKEGKLLVQKRAAGKLVYPGLWSNTCCSHPFINEKSFSDPITDCINHAISRVDYELGIKVNKEDFNFYNRMLYKATKEDFFYKFLGKEPKTQPFKEYKILDDINFIDEDEFGEYEVDYLFTIIKDVTSLPNKSEVEEIKYVDKKELKDLIYKNEFTPWFKMILKSIDLFEMIK